MPSKDTSDPTALLSDHSSREQSLQIQLQVNIIPLTEKAIVNKSLFAVTYPMEKKSLAGQGLREVIGDVGVMDRLVCNGSKDQTSKGEYFMKGVYKHGIYLYVTNPYSLNQSKIEGVIREMCKKWFHVVLRKKVLCRLS